MRLILMRHAKSDWSGGGTDHGRTLNARGRRTAPAVGAALAARGWAPQAVWSSDAARTHETWLFMAEHLPDALVHFTPRLYLADPLTIAGILARLGPDTRSAMVLAHNPGISEAVGRACGEAVELRTADAALLEHDGDDWAEAVGRRWRLVDVIRGRAVAP